MTPDQIAAIPHLSILERMTKNILFELADGTRFYLIGGKSQRPAPTGAAGFSPREMRIILNAMVDEASFKELIRLRAGKLIGEIVDVDNLMGMMGEVNPGSNS